MSCTPIVIRQQRSSGSSQPQPRPRASGRRRPQARHARAARPPRAERRPSPARQAAAPAHAAASCAWLLLATAGRLLVAVARHRGASSTPPWPRRSPTPTQPLPAGATRARSSPTATANSSPGSSPSRTARRAAREDSRSAAEGRHLHRGPALLRAPGVDPLGIARALVTDICSGARPRAARPSPSST